jgi:uncharacterized protein (DUF4415 family)
MSSRRDNPASWPDEDNPEWTADDFRQARAALEVLAEVFGPKAAETLRRGRKRPAKADRKVNQTLRLDADVMDAYRRSVPVEGADEPDTAGAYAGAGGRSREPAGRGRPSRPSFAYWLAR